MKEIVLNRKDYKTYKEFYEDICRKFDTSRFIDWEGDMNLDYSGDNLNEFLWYCHDDNLKVIFIGFDLEKIKEAKTFDDYKLDIAIKVFNRFALNYPNNSVEFRDE